VTVSKILINTVSALRVFKEELNMTMNNGPNIVEQYVFVCNTGCKNVQNCPDIFWSRRPVITSVEMTFKLLH
jgi:hypothetical protein